MTEHDASSIPTTEDFAPTTEQDNTGSQSTPKAPRKAPWLKQYGWKPGESGNRSGRRTGTLSITAAIKRALARGENINKVARAIVERAIEGDGQCLRLLLDRIDGPLKSGITATVSGQIQQASIVHEVIFNLPPNGRELARIVDSPPRVARSRNPAQRITRPHLSTYDYS